MIYIKYTLIILITLINFKIEANMLKYETQFKNSKWFNYSSKLSCKMTHEVNNFGTAIFNKNSGNDLYNFEFHFLIKPNLKTLSTVYVLPNHWQTLPQNYQLFDVDLYKGYNISFENDNVNLLLNYLEQGYKIGFIYNGIIKTNFILSNINFQQAYNKYKKCINNLLPHSFEDIQQTILHFDNNSLKLTKESKKELDKLLNYIKEDTDFDTIEINSYSDSYGTRSKNLEISKERRNKIIQQFINFGINKNIITGKSFGERHFITHNNTKEARSQNRRIIINLKK